MPQTMVIIRVHDDQPDRNWWELLDLPHPDRWTLEDTFEKDVFVELVMDVQLAPGE